jgi:hypothetical protein
MVSIHTTNFNTENSVFFHNYLSDCGCRLGFLIELHDVHCEVRNKCNLDLLD